MVNRLQDCGGGVARVSARSLVRAHCQVQMAYDGGLD